ncbi:unnamed protein product [Aphanomyces euteiches]|uniref:Armadillo repeat-containing domain-containing protein n=1 Tax=Aphanomyces euteiches TaxID=100861 RepID=A0A6G0W7T6_9STRA|nr:hypothetical protein Ae201684_018656 [Aphanomyces euteiches]
MHRVSDHLNERYPYKSGFREEYNPTEVTRAYGSSDVARYCDLLALREDDIEDDGVVAALQGLADLLASQENKVKAVEAGVIPSISRHMTSTNQSIRLGAVRVTAALAWDAQGVVSMDKDPTLLFNLNSLLFDENELCIEMAAKAFVHLTTNREGIAVVLARAYIPEKLVAMALADDNNWTQDTLLYLYTIFAQMTKSHQAAQAFANNHLVPAVVRVLGKPLMYPAPLLRYAVLTLWNLATHVSCKIDLTVNATQNEGKLDAIEANAVEKTIKILIGVQKHAFSGLDVASELDLIRMASGALMALSTCEIAKPKLVATGIPPLVACLSIESSKLNAIQTLNSICEDPSGLLPVVTLLVHDTTLLLEVFDVRCTRALNTLLEEKLQLVPVLQAVAAICDRKEGVEHITQSLHMLDNLVQLCADNPDVEPQGLQLATRIVHLIAEHDETSRSRVDRALRTFKIQLKDDI